MLIFIQFPLADLRPFLDAEDVRIPISTDFSQASLTGTADYGGNAQAPFLRSMGPLRKRQQGARVAGESLYFKGRRALAFADGFSCIPDPRDATPLPIEVFFRRFQPYQELHQLARYEMALLLSLEGRPALAGPDVQALLAACLTMPIKIPPLAEPVPLIKAGPKLAARALAATTYRSKAMPPAWSMGARMPAVLVEYGTQELSELPDSARAVSLAESATLRLAVAAQRFEQVAINTWFLSTGIDLDLARPLNTAHSCTNSSGW